MITRGTRLSPQYVQALNLIDLEFHGEPSVLEAWRELQDHYSDWGRMSDADSAAAANRLNERVVDLLSELLIKMGTRSWLSLR